MELLGIQFYSSSCYFSLRFRSDCAWSYLAINKGQRSNSGKHTKIVMLCIHFLTCSAFISSVPKNNTISILQET
jgi:hypothetical protein